ncbi:MAG TPA: ATP-binding protein [Noviherbaspirillum sp.]
MRALLRTLDWTTSPLGPPASWPAGLRMAASLMLDSKFPMFIAWGPELGFLYNDAYIDILGKKHPAAAGQRFHHIWEEIWDQILPLIQRALNGEATYAENMPLSMLRKGHEEQTWFTFSYSPLRDETGRVAGMFCACTETTSQILADRRQAFQLALTDRLRGLSDPADIMAEASEALGRHLGVARVGYAEIDAMADTVHVERDWTGGNLSSLAGETRPLASFGKAVNDQLRAGRTLVLDDVLGDERAMSHTEGFDSIEVRAMVAVPLIREEELSALLFLHEGQPRHWTAEEIALAEDVAGRTWATVERARAESQRHKAEAALSMQLEAERDRLRALFEQAPGFMAVLRGSDHVFELANAAYLRLIGPRELIGKPARAVLPEVEGQPFFGQLDRVFATGEPFFATAARITLQQAPGGPLVERFVDFVYQPVIQGKQVTGIFVEGYDVTERVHAYQALRTADRRKDEFLAMLAHELRNPLAPISAAAQLLRLSSRNEERVRQTSEVITRQVEHMTGLVDDLLDVSRVTRGLIKLDFEVLDLRDILAAAIEQARALIDTKGHRLQVECGDVALWVAGDRTRLVQIVSNLLNNAAKYTQQHGEIRMATGIGDGEIVLQVQDNGIGIGSELLPHIFEPFTQAERSPDRSQGGLGLGLALVKSLTELHGGRVQAHSAGPGSGARFELRLPQARHAQQARTSNPTGIEQARASMRVLVVDDNADAAQSLALLLEAEGHQVSLAYQGASALATATAEAPQVLLLDIGLPDMDGYELARRLRDLPQTAHALLIALTGYGQPSDRDRSRSAGFDHHLVKPADARRLAALIASGPMERSA